MFSASSLKPSFTRLSNGSIIVRIHPTDIQKQFDVNRYAEPLQAANEWLRDNLAAIQSQFPQPRQPTCTTLQVFTRTTPDGSVSVLVKPFGEYMFDSKVYQNPRVAAQRWLEMNRGMLQEMVNFEAKGGAGKWREVAPSTTVGCSLSDAFKAISR